MVVPYPLSNADHAYLMGRLAGSGAEIRAYTLKPSLEKAQTSTPMRTLSDWERERIAHLYATDIVAPKFGEIIDNTRQSPEESAQWILERLPASVTWPFEARRATPQDEEALWRLRLHREAWLAQKGMPSLAATFTVDQLRAFLREHLKNSSVWVFLREGGVLGQVRLQESDEAFWGTGSKGEAGYADCGGAKLSNGWEARRFEKMLEGA